MIERSPLSNTVSEPHGSAPDDLDESIFEMIGKHLVKPTIDDIDDRPPELADGAGFPGSPMAGLRRVSP
jgi:hypothetical protein